MKTCNSVSASVTYTAKHDFNEPVEIIVLYSATIKMEHAMFNTHLQGLQHRTLSL